jgi:hypothetical protein
VVGKPTRVLVFQICARVMKICRKSKRRRRANSRWRIGRRRVVIRDANRSASNFTGRRRKRSSRDRAQQFLKVCRNMRRESRITYNRGSWKSAEKPTRPWFPKRPPIFIGDSGRASGCASSPWLRFLNLGPVEKKLLKEPKFIILTDFRRPIAGDRPQISAVKPRPMIGKRRRRNRIRRRKKNRPNFGMPTVPKKNR